MSINDRTGQVITLHDGRLLSFAEYGDPQGVPVLFFAGLNNARFIRHPDDSIVASLGIRLISIERPGIGRSDFQPRRLLDWPDDVLQLADALNLERFSVVGASAGGPYAATCAYKIGERLTSATLVSSAPPLTVPGHFAMLSPSLKFQVILATRAPWVLGGAHRAMRWMLRRYPEAIVRTVLADLPEGDQTIMRLPGNLPLLIQDMEEALRQGGYGSAYDLRVISRPWGFRLEDIEAPVYLWQGEDDPNVPAALGRYLARAIPHCHAAFVKGGGHFLIYSHWREILAQAVAEPLILPFAG